MSKFLFAVFIILTFSTLNSNAQQNYSGNSVFACESSNETGPSTNVLYTCYPKNPSCQAFLIFRTNPPYISVPTISNLTSCDPSMFSRINNVSTSGVFLPGQEVIVPVKCSCSNLYYQANTSYVSRTVDNTYYTIANSTYQGLTTCNALMRENVYGALDLHPGYELGVPLRCACPTDEQVQSGTMFMMTYLVTWGDTVPNISSRFNVSTRSVALANGFSEDEPVLYPFTTLLIPLLSEPLSSQVTRSSPSAPSKRKRSYKGMVIGLSVGAGLSVVCFVMFIILFYSRSPKRDEESRTGGITKKLPANFLEKVGKFGEVLKIYTYQELEEATESFSAHKRLGGSIYKGTLRGKVSVIKKMGADVSKEIKILANINHFNLISLYGICENEGSYYLIFEYLEQGCLRDWLCKENDDFSHSWNQRIVIALDIANGLHYLHNFTSPAYVHKDINSRNILLNQNFRAKISNFSVARENMNSQSTCFVGEKGYMAPEYIETGKATPKVDVYAFGVVLLELITGKNAVLLRDKEEILLSAAVTSVMNGGNTEAAVNELVDPRLHIKHPLGYVIGQSEVALRLLKLSVACLAREPENRFSMAEVVSALMRIQTDVYNSQSFSIGGDF